MRPMINLLRRAVNFFFPIICIECKNSLSYDHATGVCEECTKTIKMLDSNYCVKCGMDLPDGGEHCYICQRNPKYYFENIRAACVYKKAAKTLVHRLKYGGKEYLAEPMSKMMLNTIMTNKYNEKIDAITYVPMHRIKVYMRGYNQAQLLARKLALLINKPVLEVLKRSKMTKSQYKLRKEERQLNVSGCFTLISNMKAEVSGKNLLLVDDVCTTCSTVNECSRILSKAGAEKVYVLAFARD